MAERKALSQKVRFEVFNRDSFTCQYCGAKAPDVILQVDHITPVAAGGTNDVLNLVTSCQACNSGKGCTPLLFANDTHYRRTLSRKKHSQQRTTAPRSGLYKRSIKLCKGRAFVVTDNTISTGIPNDFFVDRVERTLHINQTRGAIETNNSGSGVGLSPGEIIAFLLKLERYSELHNQPSKLYRIQRHPTYKLIQRSFMLTRGRVRCNG